MLKFFTPFIVNKTLIDSIKITVFILLSIVTNSSVQGQSGSFLVSNHSFGIDQHNIYFDGKITKTGVTYLASRNGLVKYDGRRKTLFAPGGSVLDIDQNGSGELYLATSIGLLLFHSNVSSGIKFKSLMPMNDNTAVNQVLVFEEAIYGIADNSIYYKHGLSDSTVVIEDKHAGHLDNVYELGGRIYVNSENKGTLEIIDSKMSSAVPSLLENDEVISSTYQLDTKQYILVMGSGKLYLYQNGNVQLLQVDQQKFEDTEPITAEWYDQETIVVGTLIEGVFFINIKTGKISSKFDYINGLENNEVVSIIVNENKGVSVVSSYAIDHISPNIPVRSFQYYDGLFGDVNSTAYHDERLYVGTNVGFYSLQKITNYEDVASFKKITRPNTQVKVKKKLFNFKRKKNRKQETIEEEGAVVLEKQVTKRITDTYYRYKEVDSQISNVTQILELDSQLIVGAISGVFQISGNESKQISESSARYLYYSNDKRSLFICTDDLQVLVYARQGNKWIYRDVFTDFRVQVDHIREHQGSYWLCSPDRIYKMEISEYILNDVQEYDLENPYYSTVYSNIASGELRIINSSGSYKVLGDSIVLIEDSIAEGNIVLDNQNELWIFSDKKWVVPDDYESNAQIFNAFGNINSITYSKKSASFWITTYDNQILQFSQDALIPPSYYDPYLDNVKLNDRLVSDEKLVIVQDESKLSFEITHADLSNVFDAKYRYQLSGMDDHWSDWSTDNTINFIFLPAGKYTMSIEAEDTFGKTFQIDPMSFEVLPPYWKRPLFYAFEFGVVLCLFLLSIIIKSWGYKYRFLSRLLAFLTLVIIIEYLEAIMESYFLLESSPVFSFSLQVIVAMIILPFEGLLRKYVLKESTSLKIHSDLKEKKDL